MARKSSEEKKSRVYYNLYVGPRTEGFRIPCIQLNNRNIIRVMLLIGAPEGTSLEDALRIIDQGAEAVKEADLSLTVRLQRWYTLDEPNPRDPDGFIPTVPGPQGNIVDLPPHAVPVLLQFTKALAEHPTVTRAGQITRTLRDEAQARQTARRAARQATSTKECPHCHRQVPADAVACCYCLQLISTPDSAPTPDAQQEVAATAEPAPKRRTRKAASKTQAAPTPAPTPAQSTEDGPVDLEDLESSLARLTPEVRTGLLATLATLLKR